MLNAEKKKSEDEVDSRIQANDGVERELQRSKDEIKPTKAKQEALVQECLA
jgi:hypothetical protein